MAEKIKLADFAGILTEEEAAKIAKKIKELKLDTY